MELWGFVGAKAVIMERWRLEGAGDEAWKLRQVILNGCGRGIGCGSDEHWER